MSITTSEQATPVPPARSKVARQPWWRRNLWALPLLAFLGVIVFVQARDKISESYDREPLRVAQRAAEVSETTIGVISPAVEQRWSDGDGPLEKEVKAVVDPGNEFLKPIFLASIGGGREGLDQVDRCYYLAVQHGSSFDPDTVQGIAEFCYLDPFKKPYGAGYTSVVRP